MENFLQDVKQKNIFLLRRYDGSIRKTKSRLSTATQSPLRFAYLVSIMQYMCHDSKCLLFLNKHLSRSPGNVKKGDIARSFSLHIF